GAALPGVRAHAGAAPGLGGPPGLLAARPARRSARGRAAHPPPAARGSARVLALPALKPPARLPRGRPGRTAGLAIAPLRPGLDPGLRADVGQFFRALRPGLRAYGGG